MSRMPEKPGVASFKAERTGERNLDHVERVPRQRMVDFTLSDVCHASRTVRLMLKVPVNARSRIEVSRVPILRAIQHASSQSFGATPLQPPTIGRQIECRPAIQMIEICANESGLLQSNALLGYEVRDATRWINAVVRAVRGARLLRR